jgi:hypothetical protein
VSDLESRQAFDVGGQPDSTAPNEDQPKSLTKARGFQDSGEEFQIAGVYLLEIVTNHPNLLANVGEKSVESYEHPLG